MAVRLLAQRAWLMKDEVKMIWETAVVTYAKDNLGLWPRDWEKRTSDLSGDSLRPSWEATPIAMQFP
jgi:hypothetical protein